MTNYKEYSNSALYQAIEEELKKNLNGIDNTKKLKLLSRTADSRQNNIFNNAYENIISKNEIIGEEVELIEELSVDKETAEIKSVFENTKLKLAVVSGKSMIDLGIDDSDILCYKPECNMESGEAGIFKINNKYYVKIFIKDKDKIILRSQNKLFTDYLLKSDDDFTIEGKLQYSIKIF